MKFLKMMILFPFIVLSISWPARSETAKNAIAGIQIYSDLNFIDVEGEYSGLQIMLIPYDYGLKVLWRVGAGRMSAPLLLEGKCDGGSGGSGDGSIEVTVPEAEDMPGRWTLTLHNTAMTVHGEYGIEYSLKKIQLN